MHSAITGFMMLTGMRPFSLAFCKRDHLLCMRWVVDAQGSHTP